MQCNAKQLLLPVLLVGLSTYAPAQTALQPKLLQLARKHFKEPKLTPAEAELFQKVSTGEWASYLTGSDDKDNPTNSPAWTEARTLRAECLIWLCTDPSASKLVTHRGIMVAGALISGELGLAWAKVDFPISLQKCAFTNAVTLSNARLRELDLKGSLLSGLYAATVVIEDNLVMNFGFESRGAVDLIMAKIGGDLDCSAAHIVVSSTNTIALNAARAKIGGVLFLGNGFRADGTVRLLGATVSELECTGGSFFATSTNLYAILADGINVKGGAFMSGDFRAKGTVSLSSAIVDRDLDCNGGHFSATSTNLYALTAGGIDVKGSIFLSDSFQAEGTVYIAGATVGRSLNCSGGHFISTNSDYPALNLEGANIAGYAYLDTNFTAIGEVRFQNTSIGLDLTCRDGHFVKAASDTCSLNATGLRTKGGVFLNGGFQVEGGVSLFGAVIGGDLNCDGGHFANTNKNSYALNGDGASITGYAFLNTTNFTANGGISLQNASIGLSLFCDGGRLFETRSNMLALMATGLKTKGSISLGYGFSAEGKVSLSGAIVGGDLDCYGGRFLSLETNGLAFVAESADIKGDVFLTGSFNATGGVSFIGASIGGDLDCSDGNFVNNSTNRAALNASRASVGGDLYLSKSSTTNGFSAKGEVRLVGTTVKGNLDCRGGRFGSLGTNACALDAGGAKIEGAVYLRDRLAANGKLSFVSAFVARDFQWLDVESPRTATLDLTLARVGTLWDDENSWPSTNNLILDGFIYEQIHAKSAIKAKGRIAWLRLQPRSKFNSQPYEQVAAVLRKLGRPDEAADVMVAKNDDFALSLPHRAPLRVWYFVFRHLAGYGYETWRAGLLSVAFIVAGMFIFRFGHRHALLLPSDEKAYSLITDGAPQVNESYPVFNSFIYSLEMFVPLLKLGMGESWRLNARRWVQVRKGNRKYTITGTLLRCYLWTHIIFGWFLTTLWVGGLTGLIKT